MTTPPATRAGLDASALSEDESTEGSQAMGEQVTADWTDPSYDAVTMTVDGGDCDHPALSGTDDPDVWECDSCHALIRDVTDPEGGCRSYGRDGERRYRREVVRAGEPLRVSVFDIDECPRCDGHLFHDWPHFDDPPDAPKIDQVLCLRSGCGFHVVRESTRPTHPAGAAAGRGGEGEVDR